MLNKVVFRLRPFVETCLILSTPSLLLYFFLAASCTFSGPDRLCWLAPAPLQEPSRQLTQSICIKPSHATLGTSPHGHLHGVCQFIGPPWWLSCWRICLQCRRPGFDPWFGKIPWRREQLPTPVFWPGEFHGLYSPWGCKESDMTERLLLSFCQFLITATLDNTLIYHVSLPFAFVKSHRIYGDTAQFKCGFPFSSVRFRLSVVSDSLHFY